MKPETKPWLERAEQDLQVSALAIEHEFYHSALFHAHEAIEKLLKALWVERRSEQPEKTHNLPYLARQLRLELSAKQEDFLRKLYWELIPSGYPEGEDPEAEMVQWYHEQAREMFRWLRQLLT